MKKKICFTIILLVLVVGFLELAAWLFIRSQQIEEFVPVEIGQFSELLGWEPKPNSSASSGRLGYPIEYKINSKGLRDDETTLEKPYGVFRIVLIGDSQTFGFGVPIEKHRLGSGLPDQPE